MCHVPISSFSVAPSPLTPGHDYMWGPCLFSPVYVADDDDDHNN